MGTCKSNKTAIGIEVDVLGEGSIDVEAIGGASESTELVTDCSTDNSDLAFLCHLSTNIKPQLRTKNQ